MISTLIFFAKVIKQVTCLNNFNTIHILEAQLSIHLSNTLYVIGPVPGIVLKCRCPKWET